jgi:hypothetical protein
MIFNKTMSDRLKLAREIAARTKPRFIEIPRERPKRIVYTEEQLTTMRGGGPTVEKYRAKFLKKWGKKRAPPRNPSPG